MAYTETTVGIPFFERVPYRFEVTLYDPRTKETFVADRTLEGDPRDYSYSSSDVAVKLEAEFGIRVDHDRLGHFRNVLQNKVYIGIWGYVLQQEDREILDSQGRFVQKENKYPSTEKLYDGLEDLAQNPGTHKNPLDWPARP